MVRDMRTRRQVIVCGTAAALGLSGCLEEVPEEDDVDDQNGNETDTGGNGDGEGGMGGNETDTGGNETDGDDEPATAEFDVSVDAPSASAEAGEEVNLSVTVENVGDADGRFETSVVQRGPGGMEEASTLSVGVPAGETERVRASFRHDYVGDYAYTVEATEEEFEVKTEVPELNFGEGYVNPDNVTVTVDGTEEFYEIELADAYTYTDEDGNRRFDRSGEDMEYAIVSVRSTKDTRDLVEVPRREEFTMFVGDEAYEPVDRLTDDEYEGGTTRGRTREGIVMFEIDDRFGRESDFEVYWTRDYDGGTAEAIWST